MYRIKKDVLKTVLFALVVSIVVAFSVLEIQKFQSEEIEEELADRLVPYGSIEIKKVEFKGAVLERDGQKLTWKVISPISDYLNYKAVEDWVSKALNQEGRDLSEDGEAVDWSEFGLGKGEDSSIKFTTIEGKSTVVELSEREAFDGSSYLKVSSKESGERLFTSEKEWQEVFSKKVEGFRSLQLFNWKVPSPASDLTEISFYKKGVKFLELQKNKDVWSSNEFKDWSFDTNKINSYFDELQTYLHEGFVNKNFKASDKKSAIVVATDKGERFSLAFYKGDYAVSSYRPEHPVKIDSNALSSLLVDPLDLRSFKDVDGGLPNGEYDEVQITNNKKTQKFYLKENIWTVSDEDPIKEEFNGAKVFIFLDKLKKLNFKRYVSDKGLYLKNVKKRIFLIKNKKLQVKYTIGQDVPCTEKDKKSKNCVLIATNKVQKAFMIALKKEVQDIFELDFKEVEK